MISNEGIEFCLEDGSGIGILEKIPEGNGNYQYEPFRGQGHYTMSTQVRAGSRVKCYVQIEEKIIKFIVKDIPEYGVVQIEID